MFQRTSEEEGRASDRVQKRRTVISHCSRLIFQALLPVAPKTVNPHYRPEMSTAPLRHYWRFEGVIAPGPAPPPPNENASVELEEEIKLPFKSVIAIPVPFSTTELPWFNRPVPTIVPEPLASKLHPEPQFMVANVLALRNERKRRLAARLGND